NAENSADGSKSVSTFGPAQPPATSSPSARHATSDLIFILCLPPTSRLDADSEHIPNSNLRIPVIRAGNAGAPDSDSRSEPGAPVLSQTPTDLEFKVECSLGFLSPINKEHRFDRGPPLA